MCRKKPIVQLFTFVKFMLHRFILLYCALGIFFSLPVVAVEREENLDATITMLTQELTAGDALLERQTMTFDKNREDYLSAYTRMEKDAAELAVVIYSQSTKNVFSLAYNCKQIYELSGLFNRTKYPFKSWSENMTQESERVGQLRSALMDVNPDDLTPESRLARETAITYCIEREDAISKYDDIIKADEAKFDVLGERIKRLDSYANNRYTDLLLKVFIPSERRSYFERMSGIAEAYGSLANNIEQAYFGDDKRQSVWMQSLQVFGNHALWSFLGGALVSWLMVFFLLRKRLERKELSVKSVYLTIASTLCLTSIALAGFRFFELNEFAQGLHTLGSEFLLTISVILFSITIRLPKSQLFSSLILYVPMIVLCLVFVVFRLMMVPNIIVNYMLPLLLTFTLLLSFVALLCAGSRASRVDQFYAWSSFLITLLCTLLSFFAMEFLAFVIMMVWLLLLTSAQFLIAIRALLRWYDLRMEKAGRAERYRSWVRSFMGKFVLPILTIGLILFSFVWPARIFDMTEPLYHAIRTPFVEIPDVVNISVLSVLIVILIGIVINYLIFLGKFILHEIYKDDYESGALPTVVTIATLLIWGLYIVSMMLLFKVNYSGVVVIMGGMSMGIGFALKDTIENLISGLSLMFGRVRQGDMIECDLIRGRVASIGYRSTTIETVDGSVLAFLNTQLFNKNFRNLTKNHLYENVRIDVGVAYGTNIERARQLILDVCKKVPQLSKQRPSRVVLDKFGDSSVDLAVWVWIPVREKLVSLSLVREGIYKTFKEHEISIPFPQRDLHMKAPEVVEQVVLPEPNPEEGGGKFDEQEQGSKPTIA